MSGAAHSDRKRRRPGEQVERLRSENRRFSAALDNMSQGLVMFDEDSRLILRNRRYLELYGLSPEIAKPGCTLRELIAHRIETGSFSAADPEQYIAGLMAALGRGDTVNDVVELSGGRTIAVSSRRIPCGGWVATHDDITERRQAGEAAAVASLPADAAERRGGAAPAGPHTP